MCVLRIGIGCFEHKTRYLVLILSTLCLTSILANVLTLNFTIICMAEDSSNVSTTSTYNSSQSDDLDELIPPIAPVFNWSPSTKSLLFGSVAVGALLCVFPVTLMIPLVGSKKVFFAAGLLSTVSTALCPLAAVTGDNYFVAMRILQGI